MKIAICSWKTSGRDFDILAPIDWYLQTKGFVTKWFHPYDYYAVLNWNPSGVILANTGGAPENVACCKALKKKGILIFSCISEGLFRSDNIEEFVWGWNKENLLLEDQVFYWSDKQLKMAKAAYPEVQKNGLVAGYTGIDKYFFSSRSVPKYDVGIAGFDFNNVSHIDYYAQMADKQRKFIDCLIEHPKIQKILFRPHPGDYGQWPLELSVGVNSTKLTVETENVGILESINNCAIWVAYNSSTTVDAKLFGRHTLLYNPDGRDFFSDLIEEIECHSSVQTAIDRIVGILGSEQKNSVPYLSEKFRVAYGHLDGMNHKRTAQILIERLSCEKIKMLSLPRRILYLFMSKITGMRFNMALAFYRLFNAKKYEKKKAVISGFNQTDFVKNFSKISQDLVKFHGLR